MDLGSGWLARVVVNGAPNSRPQFSRPSSVPNCTLLDIHRPPPPFPDFPFPTSCHIEGFYVCFLVKKCRGPFSIDFAHCVDHSFHTPIKARHGHCHTTPSHPCIAIHIAFGHVCTTTISTLSSPMSFSCFYFSFLVFSPSPTLECRWHMKGSSLSFC